MTDERGEDREAIEAWRDGQAEEVDDADLVQAIYGALHQWDALTKRMCDARTALLSRLASLRTQLAAAEVERDERLHALHEVHARAERAEHDRDALRAQLARVVEASQLVIWLLEHRGNIDNHGHNDWPERDSACEVCKIVNALRAALAACDAAKGGEHG